MGVLYSNCSLSYLQFFAKALAAALSDFFGEHQIFKGSEGRQNGLKKDPFIVAI